MQVQRYKHLKEIIRQVWPTCLTRFIVLVVEGLKRWCLWPRASKGVLQGRKDTRAELWEMRSNRHHAFCWLAYQAKWTPTSLLRAAGPELGSPGFSSSCWPLWLGMTVWSSRGVEESACRRRWPILGLWSVWQVFCRAREIAAGYHPNCDPGKVCLQHLYFAPTPQPGPLGTVISGQQSPIFPPHSFTGHPFSFPNPQNQAFFTYRLTHSF